MALPVASHFLGRPQALHAVLQGLMNPHAPRGMLARVSCYPPHLVPLQRPSAIQRLPRGREPPGVHIAGRAGTISGTGTTSPPTRGRFGFRMGASRSR